MRTVPICNRQKRPSIVGTAILITLLLCVLGFVGCMAVDKYDEAIMSEEMQHKLDTAEMNYVRLGNMLMISVKEKPSSRP